MCSRLLDVERRQPLCKSRSAGKMLHLLEATVTDRRTVSGPKLRGDGSLSRHRKTGDWGRLNVATVAGLSRPAKEVVSLSILPLKLWLLLLQPCWLLMSATSRSLFATLPALPTDTHTQLCWKQVATSKRASRSRYQL